MADPTHKTHPGSPGTGSSSGAGRATPEGGGGNVGAGNKDPGMKGAPGTTGGSTYHPNPGRERDWDAEKPGSGGNR